jgi:glycosyltransferase involved in cell wall biosynthesis
MKIAYLLKTFPKLSETFILNEILELERQGVDLHIFSLREPSETKMHAGVAEVKAEVTYLRYVPPQAALNRIPFERYVQRLQRSNDRWFVFLRRPVRYLKTLFFHLRNSGRRRYFEQALGLARELLKGEFTHIHAHFANEPTSVAHLAHYLTGCHFSFTAHAKDIYLADRADLAMKMAAAEFVITCTAYNRNYLAEIVAPNPPIHVCYHGVDLSRFSREQEDHRAAYGDRQQILSVGRFCEKKGFPYLLRACYLLKQGGHSFVCRIIGFGPLQEELEKLIDALELRDCVVLAGKMTQDKLIHEYRRADLFVLPCLVTDDGDRDGIPNVLVEAMAMRLPVVSTPVSGISELVDHMQNGLLAAEKDAESLAAAMEQLLQDAALGFRLGRNGRQKVMEVFSLDRNTAKVRELLLRASEEAQRGPDRVEGKTARRLKTPSQEVAR